MLMVRFERVALAEPTWVWCQSAVGVSAVGPHGVEGRAHSGAVVGAIVHWGQLPRVDFRAVGSGESLQAGGSHLRLCCVEAVIVGLGSRSGGLLVVVGLVVIC